MHNEQSGTLLAISLALAVLLTAALTTLFSVLDHGGSTEAEVRVDASLLDELADGGEVLLFRHALTDRSQSDADPQFRGGCDQQRNLSPDGVAQAQAIGAGIRSAGLPVGEVYTSPFCRTRDTAAEFGFGAPIETDALLSLTATPGADGTTATTAAAVELIESVIGGDDLVLMVTHTQNIEALTSLTVEEGDAVVLSPDGAILGVIAASDWGA